MQGVWTHRKIIIYNNDQCNYRLEVCGSISICRDPSLCLFCYYFAVFETLLGSGCVSPSQQHHTWYMTRHRYKDKELYVCVSAWSGAGLRYRHAEQWGHSRLFIHSLACLITTALSLSHALLSTRTGRAREEGPTLNVLQMDALNGLQTPTKKICYGIPLKLILYCTNMLPFTWQETQCQ